MVLNEYKLKGPNTYISEVVYSAVKNGHVYMEISTIDSAFPFTLKEYWSPLFSIIIRLNQTHLNL